MQQMKMPLTLLLYDRQGISESWCGPSQLSACTLSRWPSAWPPSSVCSGWILIEGISCVDYWSHSCKNFFSLPDVVDRIDTILAHFLEVVAQRRHRGLWNLDLWRLRVTTLDVGCGLCNNEKKKEGPLNTLKGVKETVYTWLLLVIFLE